MNKQKEIRTSNDNNRLEATADTMIIAMVALLITLGLLFSVAMYKDDKQTKEIDSLNKQRNTFMLKYLSEQEEADKLAKDLCKTKFGEYAPHLRYELDDGRVCRIVIENTFADTTGKWQKLFNNCKINKSADLSNQHKLMRGKCDSLNVEIFINNTSKQK